MISTKLARQILPQRQIKDENGQAGFSLAEVMFVLVIAAILFGIVIVAFQTLSRNGRNQARQNDRTFLQQAISRFYAQNSRFPTEPELVQLVPAEEINLLGKISDTDIDFKAYPGSVTAIGQREIYYFPAVRSATPVANDTQTNMSTSDTTNGTIDDSSLIIITSAVCAASTTNYHTAGVFNADTLNAERNTLLMYYTEEGTELLVCSDNKL